MKSEFLIAMTQLAAERNLPREKVLEAIETALVSAYKKDNVGVGLNVTVKLNPATGDLRVFAIKTVVADVEDSNKQISLEDAQQYSPNPNIDDVVEIETTPRLGRIGAQTAKQVVMQRLRDAERELVFAEYAHREGEVVSGIVQRMEVRTVIVGLGRAEAILPVSEQSPMERYRPGQQLQVCLLEVRRGARGPEIIASRTHKALVQRLFELEVPEISNGIVEIMAIAREPGYRSKMAVTARQEGVDPVGTCVGLRGIRIQNVINELQGEKVDVVPWHRDPGMFIANALSPAQVQRTELNNEGGNAVVVVADRQLSLAIGREGQNVRLAAKLTGWKIDIKSASEYEAERLGWTGRVEEVEKEDDSVPESVITEATDQVAASIPEATDSEVEIAVEPATGEADQSSDVEVNEEAPVREEQVGTTLGIEMPSYERIVEEMGETVGPGTAGEEPAAVEINEGVEEEISSDAVWTMPTAEKESASGIRFAEDILPDWGRGRAPKKDKKRDKGRNKRGPGGGPGGSRVRPPSR